MCEEFFHLLLLLLFVVVKGQNVRDDGLEAAETGLPFYVSHGFGGGRGFGGGNFGGFQRSPYFHSGGGGQEFDENFYNKDYKNYNDGSYNKAGSHGGGQSNKGESGFSQDNVGLKSSKADAGFYNDHHGGKKNFQDEKFYNGRQHFTNEGQNSDEKKQKSGHKKGHVVKGFKSSHHKDEDKKTEEYYDESDDEGGSLNLHEQGKNYGENSQAGYKGGYDDEHFVADVNKKGGGYDSEQFFNKNDGETDNYGQQNYAGNQQTYGSSRGNDFGTLRGHYGSSKVFKHYPYHYY